MLIQGDAPRIPLPDRSVHIVVTSPPYWGLRRYSGVDGRGMFPDLGLEKSPQEYIERIVAIMAEVHRVLRDDGIVWLNYGDCYASGQIIRRDTVIGGGIIEAQEKWQDQGKPQVHNLNTGISQGNLMLMPHRIAIALQDWGWIVRNDLVWFKRNPMPESQAGWRFERARNKIASGKYETDEKQGHTQTGAGFNQRWRNEEGWSTQYEYLEDYELRKGSWRHTRAHEYVFMLSKKMQYWSNQEAVREQGTSSEYDKTQRKQGRMKDNQYMNEGAGYEPSETFGTASGSRNPRSVLDVPTAPYKGSHYATFPPNLIAPLIRATCPRWACPVCGQGWSPVVEKATGGAIGKAWLDHSHDEERGGFKTVSSESYERGAVKEYRPTCDHKHTKDEALPGIVLDPFVGSGTTVMVAKELLRRGIGLDISMEYLDEQAKIRTGISSPSNQFDELPLFADLDL